MMMIVFDLFLMMLIPHHIRLNGLKRERMIGNKNMINTGLLRWIGDWITTTSISTLSYKRRILVVLMTIDPFVQKRHTQFLVPR